MTLTVAERIGDDQEALRVMMQGMQAGVYTSCIGIVQSFNPTAITLTAQPAIQARVTAADGTVSNQTLPLLVDVPVVFPGGGAFVSTFPIEAGDEVLIIFSQRSIDAWFQLGGVQPQTSYRMHDIADGMAIPCMRSLRRPLAGGVSADSAQLRTVDGTTSVTMGPTGLILTHPVAVRVMSPILTHNGVNIGLTHKHGGVTSGGSNTGNPI